MFYRSQLTSRRYFRLQHCKKPLNAAQPCAAERSTRISLRETCPCTLPLPPLPSFNDSMLRPSPRALARAHAIPFVLYTLLSHRLKSLDSANEAAVLSVLMFILLASEYKSVCELHTHLLSDGFSLII